MTAASIYRFKDRWVVSPVRTTTTGLLVGSEPFVTLPLDASNSSIGSAIKNALVLSKDVIPHPSDWKRFALPRLTAAGVKTERSFQLGGTLVEVQSNGQLLTFTPTRNGGAVGDSKGFYPLADEAFEMTSDSDDILGETLCKAIERCS